MSETLVHRLSQLGLSGYIKVIPKDYVLIKDDMVMGVGDDFFDREEQECWCPDAFLESGFNVRYCPQHGCDPDPELWTIPWSFPL